MIDSKNSFHYASGCAKVFSVTVAAPFIFTAGCAEQMIRGTKHTRIGIIPVMKSAAASINKAQHTLDTVAFNKWRTNNKDLAAFTYQPNQNNNDGKDPSQGVNSIANYFAGKKEKPIDTHALYPVVPTDLSQSASKTQAQLKSKLEPESRAKSLKKNKDFFKPGSNPLTRKLPMGKTPRVN